MALEEGPVREVVARERVLPGSTPTAASLVMLRAWQAEIEAGCRPATSDVLARLDHLIGIVGSLQTETSGLRFALTSRTAIDTAKGILMAKRGCSEDTALEILVRLPSEAQVPAREIARAIVYQSGNRT